MTDLTIYLLKSSLSMALLYSIYWIFLRRETIFMTTRYYLVSSLILSLVLPMITIHYSASSPESGIISEISGSLFANSETATKHWYTGISKVLLLVYLIGVMIFLIRIVWQSAILISLIIKNGIKHSNGNRVVENERYLLPFSFMKIIFINPQYIRENELDDIISHEKVHIRENHWFDLLLVELMTIILWFNPFIWFFERSIKQNHEYLADKGVIAQGNSVGRYHSVLINQLMGMEVIGITNNLNYSLNAKRLKMMKKTKTPKLKALHILWALPVVFILLAAFAQPEYEKSDNYKTISIENPVKLTCAVFDNNGDPIPGATAQIKGANRGVTTDKDGLFTIEVEPSDIVIVKFRGFSDNVIYMEKIVEKQGKSDQYKLKLKMSAENGKEVLKPNGAENEVANLENMLKELALKKDELIKMKEKIAQIEKEGKVDKDELEKKKASWKKEYMAVDEKMKKVKTKLKSLQK